ncbi:hypothetical protein B5S30_g3758 [[Candida] boidinii]|nr:hypothetical protein B5S30_g3758 [[Candida] boidinii]
MSDSKILSVEFFYENPPKGYFSQDYPIIGATGTNFPNLAKSTDDLYLKIKFLQKLDKVDTINIIFSGEINVTFEHYYTLQPYYTPDQLDNILKMRKHTETKVEILTEKLSLPKSFLNKHYEKYFKLDYQSGNYFDLDRNLNYLDSNISLKDRDSHCFKKKPRRFILDEGTNLVESPLNGSHRHTRIIRSMFSDSYKKSNYKNLTKDVDLVLKFKPNSFINNLKNSFDITDNFISQLGVLRIETNSVVNNSLVPDYVINNKSTELGKFHFKYLKIYMIDNL